MCDVQFDECVPVHMCVGKFVQIPFVFAKATHLPCSLASFFNNRRNILGVRILTQQITFIIYHRMKLIIVIFFGIEISLMLFNFRPHI